MRMMVVRAAVDEAEPEGAMHRTGGVEGAVHLPQGPPDGGHGVRGPAGPGFAPVGRAPVVRLGGPSAGPVRIQDARTLNTAPAPADRRGRRRLPPRERVRYWRRGRARRRRRRVARDATPRCDIQMGPRFGTNR